MVAAFTPVSLDLLPHSCSCVYSPSPEPSSCRSAALLLLLLSRFSRVRLCATPQTAAHQALPSLGFSRQDHWSGSAALQPSLFTRRSSSKTLALSLTWRNYLFREKINILLLVLTACHFSSFYQYSMSFKICLKRDSPVISFILLKRLQWFLIV